MEQNTYNESEMGTVKIANEVVSVMAGLAATEIEGVVGMASTLASEISQIFAGKKNVSKGVKVTVENGNAVIDLFLAVQYGIKIHETCKKVQENVKKTVETMAGLTVSCINVYVQSVVLPKEEKQEVVE